MEEFLLKQKKIRKVLIIITIIVGILGIIGIIVYRTFFSTSKLLGNPTYMEYPTVGSGEQLSDPEGWATIIASGMNGFIGLSVITAHFVDVIVSLLIALVASNIIALIWGVYLIYYIINRRKIKKMEENKNEFIQESINRT
jgi:hypothetical protein